MAEDLEAEDVIDLNGQASGADGDPPGEAALTWLPRLTQLEMEVVNQEMKTYSNWVIVSVLCLSFTYLSMHVVCWVVELSIYVELEMW
ncbi:hypothetical protein HAX54_000622 [Datura stramonium]|uniref:Uncharacterized protein n=1 Tax=Datura stramonium TaxID=4076 RepID=A0ABS8RVA9_DATST|nr:hypothetical protein [Datura stramonium]